MYYAQRSTKQGLLISEATDVMPAISEYAFLFLSEYCLHIVSLLCAY